MKDPLRPHSGPRIRTLTVGKNELPVLDFQGRDQASGPSVVLTANLHGDECTGLGALLALIPRFESVLRRGRLRVLPTLNPSGLERRQRRVPQDDHDLNRIFPGSAQGSESDRLAAAIWAELASARPDLVVDLHSDAPQSLPYVLLDRATGLSGEARRALEARNLALAEMCGLTVVHEYPDEQYRRFSLDKSLSGAVLNRLRVPALTIEAGPRLYLNPDDVAVLEGVVLRILAGMNLTDPVNTAPTRRVAGRWRRDSGPRAPSPGVFRPRVTLGEQVQAGALVADLYDV